MIQCKSLSIRRLVRKVAALWKTVKSQANQGGRSKRKIRSRFKPKTLLASQTPAALFSEYAHKRPS